MNSVRSNSIKFSIALPHEVADISGLENLWPLLKKIKKTNLWLVSSSTFLNNSIPCNLMLQTFDIVNSEFDLSEFIGLQHQVAKI